MPLQERAKRTIRRAIDSLENFRLGNISGENFSSWQNVPLGRLSQNNPRYAGVEANMAVYVIFSYGTPIAWKFSNAYVWVIPNYTYSMSTTNHQNVLRAELGTAFYTDEV